jgi:hypothetical protein
VDGGGHTKRVRNPKILLLTQIPTLKAGFFSGVRFLTMGVVRGKTLVNGVCAGGFSPTLLFVNYLKK